MEQFVLIILIGLIGLVNFVIQKSAEAREKRKLERKADYIETREEQVGGPQAEKARDVDPNESMRRLMEALGLPEDEAPPPPIPRREPAPQPLREPRPEPMTFVEVAPVPPPLPARKALDEGLPRFHGARAKIAPVLKAMPAYQWDRKASPPQVDPASRVRAMLESPQSLRDGIILTEILGKPKSLS